MRQAVRLNAAGALSSARPRRAWRPAPRPFADLRAALAPNPKARASLAALPPSGRQDHADRLIGAKRAETRARRLEQAVVWLAAGTARNGRQVA